MDLVAMIITICSVASAFVGLFYGLRMVFFMRENIRSRALVDVVRTEMEAVKMYLNFLLHFLGFTDIEPFEIENVRLFEMYKERQLKKTMLSKIRAVPESIQYYPNEKERKAFEKLVYRDKRNLLRQEIRHLGKWIKLLARNVQELDFLTKKEWRKAKQLISDLDYLRC